MNHVSSYSELNHLSSVINEALAGHADKLSKALSLETIKKECDFLNKIEESVPEDLRFQLELDMILKRGIVTSTDYYKNLMGGVNSIVRESLNHMSQSEITKLNESYSKVIREFGFKKVNESDISLPFDIGKTADDVMSFFDETPTSSASGEFTPASSEAGDDVMAAVSGAASPSQGDWGGGGILGMLKGLLSALTEGGSPIGILHFVLDLIGLFGSAFEPVGLIADIINGIIYMIRGKWLLALINFICAALPFAGDLFKGWFKGSKAGAEVLQISTRYMGAAGGVAGGSAKMSKDAINLAAAARPESWKALDYIGKSTKGVLGTIGDLIAKFFGDFLGTVVGWIPFIGKPLRSFFEGIADMFGTYSAKMNRFASNIPQLLDAAKVQKLDDFFMAAASDGARIEAKGADLIVNTKSGTAVKLDAEFLKETDFITARYGTNLTSEMSRVKMNANSFYGEVGGLMNRVSNTYGQANKFGKIFGTITIGKMVPLFIGKQVLKLIGHFGQTKKFSEGEYELFGNAAVQQKMQEIMDRELKENPDASYSVPYIDAFENNDAVPVLQNNLDYYAKKFNLPRIVDVVYYTSGEKDKLPPEVAEWYSNVHADNPDYYEEMKLSIDTPPELKDSEEETTVKKDISESTKFKHVIPYSKW
jgi:hypothetical protein